MARVSDEPAGDVLDAVTLESQGGIGNQLFIYALARAIEVRSGTPVQIDLWRHKLPGARPHAIGPLVGESLSFIDSSIRGPMLAVSRYNWCRHLMCRFPKWKSSNDSNLHEQVLTFDPAFLQPQPGSTLTGYFQSWKYFADISDRLRDDLQSRARSLLVGSGKETQQKGTAVHIRLGDYLDRKHRAFHKVDLRSYYEVALARALEIADEPDFVVFSDDAVAAQKILRDCLPTGNWRVYPSTNSDLLDLLAMAGFDQIVCSNSTYSWWAAWISGIAGDRIFVPQRWINRTDFALQDLVPSSWTIL